MTSKPISPYVGFENIEGREAGSRSIGRVVSPANAWEDSTLKTSYSVKIHATSVVRVEDFETLHAYWRSLSRSARSLVGKWICTRLTTEQYERLPRELKARLKVLAWA